MWEKIKAFAGNIYWREITLCAPALFFVLAFSLALPEVSAVVVVGAAFSVGFGASRRWGKHRWGVTLMATAGMSVAAFVGTLMSNDPMILFPAIAILAGLCALLTTYDNNLWWISLQIVIAFLVASYYPRDLDDALLRAFYVATGGLLQLVGMMTIAHFFPRSAATLPLASVENLTRDKKIRFVLSAMIAVVLSLYVARSAGLANNYWAPMTAMLILRPTNDATLTLAINRFAGTLFGCILGTLIVYGLYDNYLAMLLCLLISASCAFSMQKAHYALLTSMVSATIVFLIALANGDPISTTEHRIVAMLLGGAVAIMVGRVLDFRSNKATV